MARVATLSAVAAALVAVAASLPLGVYQITSQDTQLLLRHCDYQAFATPNEAGDLDFWWEAVPALDGNAAAISFESTNYPSYFMVPITASGLDETTRLGIVPKGQFDLSDASFIAVPGLANPNATSFVSASKNATYAGLHIVVAPGMLSGQCASGYSSPAGDVFLDDGTLNPLAATWNAQGTPSQQTGVRVDAANVTHIINPLVIGCHSDDGYTRQPRGIYSQMVLPEAFESNPDGHWLNATTGNIVSSVASDSKHPFNGVPSMQFTYTSGSGGFAGLSNRGLGQEGYSLEASRDYEGYIFVQGTGAQAATLYIALRDYTTNTVLAQQTFTVLPGTSWVQLNFSLTTSAGTTCVGIEPGSDPVIDCGTNFPAPAHVCVRCGGEFIVGLTAPGTVNVGYVFLQPGTWGRFNGQPVLLSYAQTLQAMGTRVIRQGGTFSQTMAWKQWRGPAWTRPSMGHVWGQSLVSGWGPFEFIDLVNALNIEPVITLQMEQSVQDWADLVEYLFGDSTTTWGAQRIADGHPQVYNATWFELGNEEYNPNWVAQASAMEAKATELGMPGVFRYMFPTNTGLNAADAAAAQAAGIPVHNIMPDIHIGAGGAVAVAESDFAALPNFAQTAINGETNAGTHDLVRGLQEADDLNTWFNTPEPVNSRLRARTASFCAERSGHFDAFDQGLSFFLSNMTWLQPPGYVHQMISNTWAPYALSTNFTAELDFSVSAQLAADSQSIVVRIVNQLVQPSYLPLTLANFNAAPNATKWTLTNPAIDAENTPSAPTLVSPVQGSITFNNNFANVTIPGGSYVIIQAFAA